MNRNTLDNVCIILVDCRTPANIGSTARCMMNMGLSRLRLVRPPKDRWSDAKKLAAGADEVLQQAVVFDTLAEAVADRNLVIGTSRHSGRRRKNMNAPRDMAERVAPLLLNNKAAIVFGNEVNGLENSDLALCHEFVTIPSSKKFPSLNLSQAVMILAYELFVAAHDTRPFVAEPLATVEDAENFYRHLQRTLLQIEFLDRANAERMMSVLRQLFGRARMDSREVGILRGILSSIDRIGAGDRPDQGRKF